MMIDSRFLHVVIMSALYIRLFQKQSVIWWCVWIEMNPTFYCVFNRAQSNVYWAWIRYKSSVAHRSAFTIQLEHTVLGALSFFGHHTWQSIKFKLFEFHSMYSYRNAKLRCFFFFCYHHIEQCAFARPQILDFLVNLFFTWNVTKNYWIFCHFFVIDLWSSSTTKIAYFIFG